ncbi:UPF0016-domain-containing protein [Dentipellis sp. KUC8613]|nr:UPF0016-domain-containing protein [Dentipellis sp. KUC8613]
MSAENGTTPAAPETALSAFAQAFLMILVSEVGDKTFLIAAILAMRHPRLTVFLGAFGSLALMSALSAALGHLLPTLIPKRWTQAAAAVLFLVFGVKMGLEGREMKAGSDKMREEMREAEEEIEEDAAVMDGAGAGSGATVPLEELEEGVGANGNGIGNGHARRASVAEKTGGVRHMLDGARNLCSLFLGPIFVQAFVLTFLGEWGDRSQIATIALAAAHNPYLVTIGTILGHSCCTAVAVVGGRYVSTKISPKHVTLGGAALFLCFGVIYLYAAYESTDIDVDMHIPRE